MKKLTSGYSALSIFKTVELIISHALLLAIEINKKRATNTYFMNKSSREIPVYSIAAQYHHITKAFKISNVEKQSHLDSSCRVFG